MKRTILLSAICLFAYLAAGNFAVAQDEPERDYSIWIGAHYTDFQDYAQKVGEYRLIEDQAYPEIKGFYTSRTPNSMIVIEGQYFDKYNIKGRFTERYSDRVEGELYYQSMVHNKGRDLLTNLSARELIGENPGGKMLTHEAFDEGVNYSVHREEWGASVNALLVRKHNVRLMAAHRSIITTGNEQEIASNHCFSCHVTSQSHEVDKVTRQFEVGLQGDIGPMTVGYEFDYRKFESNVPPPFAYYDNAKHPVHGGSQEEFGSRVNYEDAVLPYSTYPETRKTGHKFRIKGDIGDSRISGSLAYNITKNLNSNLEADAWSGTLNFSTPLSKRMRLIARAFGVRLKADDPRIDVPLWREGRPGPQVNFDYLRYSTLDRADGGGSVELISKLTDRITASAKVGFERIDRYDYPEPNGNYVTNKIIGELSGRYRKGLRYSTRVKYHFEMIDDPFISGRGLFEAQGHGVLEPMVDGFSFIFYFQREDLRYQNITTFPTMVHDIEWQSQWRPNNKVNVTLGLKFYYDQNDDLDSLDVEHLNLRPNIAVTLTPQPRLSMTAGYTLGHYKSRGPVTVALFDG